MRSTTAAGGAALAVAAAVTAYLILRLNEHVQRLKAELMEEERKRKHAEEVRMAERTGRITAERRLTAALQQLPQVKEVQKNVQTFQHAAIGYVESCFRSRFGTPRQGCIVDSARSRLKISSALIDANGALEALDQYSHVWLVFVFHENTNGAATVKAKVTPPKLGSRVGVFSTRSPHRPNAIGLTLARLDRVAGDTLHLAGADLVDGTPILDVKPYIALYDSLPEGGSTQPAWIAKPSVAPFEDVRFTEEAARDIALLIPRSRLYAGESVDYVLGFVAGVLREDIRSGHARQSKDEAEVYNVWLDVMRIHWRIDRGTTVTVLGAEHAP